MDKTLWEIVSHVLEAMGLFFIPFLGWTLMQIISHSKQIIILESKVNDSLDRRMLSIERKVENLEYKLDKKISAIEENVIDCKMSINTLITEKFETLMAIMSNKSDKRNVIENN